MPKNFNKNGFRSKSNEHFLLLKNTFCTLHDDQYEGFYNTEIWNNMATLIFFCRITVS